MKKKTLSRVGAGALAIATVVAGLSFGPAAATAATTNAPSTDVLRTFTSPIGWKLADGSYAGVFNVTDSSYAKKFATESAFLTGSHKVKVTQYKDQTFTLEDMQASGPRPSFCPVWTPKVSGIQGFWGSCTGTAVNERWTPNADGSISPVADPAKSIGGLWTTGAPYLIAATPGAKLVGDASVSSLFFGAAVESIDLHARTAVVTGNAAPNAYVVINGTSGEVQADENGNWTATVSGLKLGKNTVKLEEYHPAGTKTNEASVEIDLQVASVTAAAVFETDNARDVKVSGRAEPGATIQIDNAEGAKVGSAVVDAITGNWSTTLTAPNAGGNKHFTVFQVIDGERNGDVAMEIDYGRAVQLTSPVNNAEHTGGPLHFAGTGEPGSTIEVTKKNTENVVADGRVLANGQWVADAKDIPGVKATYVVTQKSKGGNTTTSEVVLNPDADYRDVTVTAPVSGSQFKPDTSVRFAGQGTPGGTITLTPTNGAAVVTTTVDENGNWAINRILGNGPYTFNVQQVADGKTSHVNGIALTPEQTAPIDKTFAVSSPTTGSSVKNQAVTFTGTGAAGTTVRIHTTNFASADITTVVKNDGTWSVNKWIGDGPYVMDITQEGRITGAVRGFEINNDVAVNKPFTVTTPTAGDDIRSQVATFTGTGRHGETVTIKATSPAGLAEVSGIVKKDGTWSINRFTGDGPYAFDIIQTKNGVESGAERDFRINQPAKGEGVTGPFVVTGPATGSTFTPNTQVTFTGTGTTGATVTVTPTNGASAVTAVVGTDGTWSVKKFLGNGPYTFELASEKDGATETAAEISITPAP